MGKVADRGKSLPDIAPWAILCRTAPDQLLENAPRSLWPPSCNFRRVAALAIPPSLLAPSVRASTPGASTRPLTEPQADQTSGPEATASGDGIFPELLAGLVGTTGAAAGDGHAASSDGAPHLDTPGAMKTWLKATLSALPGDAAVPAAGAAPVAKRGLAARRAGSTEPSDAAPELAAPAQASDPGQLAAPQTISAILMMQPAPTTVVGQRDRPAPPSGGTAVDEQVSSAPETTPAMKLEAEVQLPGPGVTAVAANRADRQTVGVAQKPAPLEAVAVVQPVASPETAGGQRSPRASIANSPQTGNPGGEEVHAAPAGPQPSAPVALESGQTLPVRAPNLVETEVDNAQPSPQPSIPAALHPDSKLPVRSVNPAAGSIESSPQPAARSATQKDAPIAVTEPPSVSLAPADESSRAPSKRVDPALAQAAPAAAQLSPQPVLRPPSVGLGDAVPADEIAVHGGLSAPVASSVAASDPVDLSGRRANRAEATAPPSRRSSASVVAQVLALSGQAPRTVDSIPTAAPAPQPAPASRPTETPAEPRPGLELRAQPVPPEAAQANSAESLVPSPDTAVQALGTSTPDRDEVAFALRVRALPASDGPLSQAAPSGLSATKANEPALLPVRQEGSPSADPAAAAEKRVALPDDTPDRAPARAGRERHGEELPTERTGPTAGKTIPPVSPDAQVRTETAPERPQAATVADAKPARPQDLMEDAAKPDVAKAPPVHDMKFEVTGGQQRVEVRLSERAGEVKMTVRTADEPLADTLRENLPALSARLAESGLKSEAWHPAASSTNELRHNAEPGARGASQDADSSPRQQDQHPQDGAGQRRPKSPQQAAPQKEKGKDFAWLMSSLR